MKWQCNLSLSAPVSFPCCRRAVTVAAGAALSLVLASSALIGETCTTQSQMQVADRDALAVAARQIVTDMQKSDLAGLQSLTVAEFASNFAAIRSSAIDTGTHLAGDALSLESIFLLDASSLPASADAQFFCTLNHSQAEVDFSIRGLSAGLYGFAVVTAQGPNPWRVSLLLRKDAGHWLLAGFFPAPTTVAGHDGLWFWRQARQYAAGKQPWNAWLYYTEAQSLLQPAPFVQTSHLERLQDEQKAAAPPALSNGISPSTPLVVRGPDGKEFRFTGLSVNGTSGRDKVEVLARVEGTAGDAAAIRAEGDGAAHALVTAYPELRSAFSGVLTSLELPGQSPFVTDHPMTDIH